MFRKLVLLLIVGCASTEANKPVVRLSEVKEVSQAVRPWLVSCAHGIACKEGDRGDGDSLLWAGLLCLSGEESQCLAAEASQGLDGRIWRSPSRVNVDTIDSASRDMLVGFQAYLVVSKNQKAATLLMDYLDRTGRICPDGTEFRCELTPTNGAIMYYVYKAIGLEPTVDMMIARASLEVSLASAATAAPTGFPLHLVAAQLLILREAGYWNESTAGIAGKLSERQPDNPFFRYLAEGPTNRVVDSFLAKAPKSRPAKLNQWSWERDTESKAWLESMGWDFVFLANLIGR